MGDRKVLFLDYIKKEHHQKIEELVLTESTVMNSLELEELLSVLLEKYKLYMQKQAESVTLNNEAEKTQKQQEIDEDSIIDPESEEEDKYIEASKRLSKQPTQLIAFFIEKCDPETSEKLKQHLSKKTLTALEDTFVSQLPFEDETFALIESEIFKNL